MSIINVQPATSLTSSSMSSMFSINIDLNAIIKNPNYKTESTDSSFIITPNPFIQENLNLQNLPISSLLPQISDNKTTDNDNKTVIGLEPEKIVQSNVELQNVLDNAVKVSPSSNNKDDDTSTNPSTTTTPSITPSITQLPSTQPLTSDNSTQLPSTQPLTSDNTTHLPSTQPFTPTITQLPSTKPPAINDNKTFVGLPPTNIFKTDDMCKKLMCITENIGQCGLNPDDNNKQCVNDNMSKCDFKDRDELNKYLDDVISNLNRIRTSS
jgi:hypothetical protein